MFKVVNVYLGYGKSFNIGYGKTLNISNKCLNGFFNIYKEF